MKTIKKLTTIIMSLFLVALSYGAFNCYGFVEDKDIPTIEQLTNGKLKVGDTFGEEHLAILKDYLPPACQVMLERGMKGVIVPQIPFEQQIPPSFMAATKKNQGKAFIDENRVVWMKTPQKEKDYWAGGYPFWPDANTALEVMSNHRFGKYHADTYDAMVRFDYVDQKGRSYKQVYSSYHGLNINPRVKLPPVANFDVYKDENFRIGVGFHQPYDVKGLTKSSTKYYDNIARPDDGFIYIPALKRTLRISSSTWTDNIAGSDITWGDGDMGLGEPFIYWEYNILEKDKFMLMPTIDHPSMRIAFDNTEDPPIPTDVGKKFVRLRYNVRPVYILEATPTVDHIYGKRIWYIDSQTYRFYSFENYDRQGELWKIWLMGYMPRADEDGEIFSFSYGVMMYDLQKDHMSRLTSDYHYIRRINDPSRTIEDFSLKALMQMGE